MCGQKQLGRVISLLLTCRFQGSNLGFQSGCWCLYLPAGPYNQPMFCFFKFLLFVFYGYKCFGCMYAYEPHVCLVPE